MSDPYEPPMATKSRKKRNRGKNLRSSNSSETMEQEIWKELPEDLLEAVILRLPVSSFFRFLSVSRKWNSLLASHNFSEQFAGVQKSRPWFCAFIISYENENVALYDPTTKNWRHPAISSLFPSPMPSPVASASGLICCIDDKDFYVFNPLTHSLKKLPSRPSTYSFYVGMTQNDNSISGGYKIICLDGDYHYGIYDSLKNSWSLQKNLPSTVRLTYNIRSNSVSVGDTVYFMLSYLDSKEILSYNMGSGVWKHYPIPIPPNSRDHHLVDFGGQLGLVGLLMENDAICVCIWDLQKRVVDKMPYAWCSRLYKRHGRKTRFMKSMRMICLSNNGLLMLSLLSSFMFQMFAYDFAKREWLKIPSCVLPGGRSSEIITSGSVFYPVFSAP